MSEPFIGKPLPMVGDIIENDGLKYKVIAVERNEFISEVDGNDTYRVTLIPSFDWVDVNTSKEGGAK